MKCMLCGKENPDDALYCGGCGWPQKKQKKSHGGLIVAVGMAAVLLLAAIAFLFFRPAKTEPAAPAETSVPTQETAAEPSAEPSEEAPAVLDRYCEKVAETFVELYWENDMPTLETVVEYHLFNFLEDELDTGRSLPCTAEAGQFAPCDADRVMGLQMSLGVNIAEAYSIRVNYETPEKTGSTEVTVGKVDENWVVISFAPFFED
ncbi:MAG: zinc ribbon domain-containing protein [Oscillospiraceae bacterium]|nr:zinc ribbon domain-containing protein [Oscillospiraceae bacterium]